MNKLYLPKKELQAFMALSRVRPANSTFNYMSSQCNRLLLIDVSGKRVKKDINFDILTQKHKGGAATLSCDYDAALLAGIMAFYKATQKLVRVTFPQEYFQPLQVNALDGSCNALLMPVRR